jgi:hypothetical protein
MASKKKRPPARPSGSRPAAKRPAPTTPVAKGGAGPKAPPAAPNGAAKPARERTGPTRAERLAAAEAARRRKASRTRALVTAGVVAVLVLLTVTIVNSRRSNSAVISKLEASGACSYDTKSDSDGGPGNNHVNGDVSYKVNPPSGGNHNPTPSPPGIFTADTTPPDAQIVHSLEHGYIAIWYRPDIDTAQLDSLKTLANKYDRDVLLVPRASLTDKPVAATAWHRRLLCSRPDTDALEKFITAYRNKGPEKVSHNV